METIFVHVWGSADRIYETGMAERAYTPDPGSAASLRSAAQLTGGRVLGEGEGAEAADAAAAVLGEGPTRKRILEGERRALMPYATMLVLLPLGFVLLRRNL